MIFASCDLTVRIEDTLAACPYYRGTGRCTGMASCSSAQEPICITDEPSGGWESWVRAQHNEPNPILVALRQSDLNVSEWRAAIISAEIYGGIRAWDEPSHRFHVFTKATDEQLDHADRVLTRLQDLS